jgi:hypothetical protein
MIALYVMPTIAFVPIFAVPLVIVLFWLVYLPLTIRAGVQTQTEPG